MFLFLCSLELYPPSFPPWLGLLWMMGLSPISSFRQFSFTVHNLYTILHTLSIWSLLLVACIPLLVVSYIIGQCITFLVQQSYVFADVIFITASLCACATSLLHKPMLNMAVQKGDTSSFFIYVPCQKVLQHSHGSLAPS